METEINSLNQQDLIKNIVKNYRVDQQCNSNNYYIRIYSEVRYIPKFVSS